MKKITLLISAACCLAQCSPNAAVVHSEGGGEGVLPATPVPDTFFGMVVVNPDNWPTVSITSLKRTGMSWRHLEPRSGKFKWDVLDDAVSEARQHGVTYFYTTDSVPRWAAADPKSCQGADSDSTEAGCSSGVAKIGDWDNFVRTLVARYRGKIQCYELWNEPDQNFTGPISELVILTQHMHDIIRKLDPSAMIASPAPLNARWSDSYWAAGGVNDVDVVSIHGYPTYFPAKPEIIGAQKAQPMRAVMTKYGLANKPLWDTEASWGDDSSKVNDPEEQAAFLARFYLLHWSAGFARFYWYSWDDNGDGPGGVGWGTLFNPNSRVALPAARAYQQVYRWMVGATMTEACAMAEDSTWSCPLSRPGGHSFLAVWNSDKSKTYIPAKKYKEYQDLAGNNFPVRGGVTIGMKPVLFSDEALSAHPAASALH